MMKVLSLFDGISCGLLALKNIGIPVSEYFASEICADAISVSKNNHPEIQHLGSVIHLTGSILPKIDLLIGGSPCQGFSFAGSLLNFEDPRSKLFFEFVRLYRELKAENPNIKFLLENVKMKKEHQDVISDILGVDPFSICSSDYSPGKRKRLYWTNIKFSPTEKCDMILRDCLQKEGSFEYLKPNEIERGVYKYSGKVWKSGNKMGNMKFPDDVGKKARCLTAVSIKAARETIHIKDDKGIRLLNSREYEIINGIPLGYTRILSESKAKKCIGNGWNIPTIERFFVNL